MIVCQSKNFFFFQLLTSKVNLKLSTDKEECVCRDNRNIIDYSLFMKLCVCVMAKPVDLVKLVALAVLTILVTDYTIQ